MVWLLGIGSNAHQNMARSRETPMLARRVSKPCGVFAFVALMQSAIAMDLSFSPTARIGSHADDNIRGASDDKEGAWGFEQGGSLGMIAQSSRWSVAIRPHFNIRRYVSGENLDFDEYGSSFNGRYDLDRVTTELEVGYRKDSTLSTEVTDVGFKNNVTSRDTVNVTPSFAYEFDESTNVQVEFGFTDTSFGEEAQGQFLDYRYMIGSLTLNRLIGEQDLVFATPFVSEFESPEIKNTSRTYGGQAGYMHVFSPTLKATGSVGYVSSSIEFLDAQPDPTRPVLLFDVVNFRFLTIFPFTIAVPAETSTSGAIASAKIEKKLENGQLSLDYSRQLSPTARGAQQVADTIIVNGQSSLSDRLSLIAFGSYVMASSDGDQFVPDLDRNQAFMQGSVVYRLTEHISVQGAYSYAYRLANERGESVGQHSISVYFTYDGGARPIGGGY